MTRLRNLVLVLTLAACGTAAAHAFDTPDASDSPPPQPTPANDDRRICDAGAADHIPESRRIVACTALIESGDLGPQELAGAYADRGDAYYVQGGYAAAIADYDKAISLVPPSADGPSEMVVALKEHLGFAYQAASRQEKSIAVFDAVLAVKPDSADAYFGRGRAFHVLGLSARGRLDLDRALELRPDFKEAFIARGLTELSIGDVPAARRDFESALRLQPDYADALYGRGRTYKDMSQYDLAIQDLDRALKLDPALTDAATQRTAAMAAQDAWKQRLAVVPPMPVNPPSGDANTSVMPSHAVGATHTCDSAYPEASRKLFESGDVQVRYDVDVTGAIGNVMLVKSSGSDRLDRAGLSCVAALWRNTPATRGGTPLASPGHQAIVRFVIEPPSAAIQFDIRAGGHVAIGEYDLALVDMNQAIALDPTQPLAFYHRGLVYMMLGKFDEAQADFDKARHLNATDAEFVDSAEMLETLRPADGRRHR